MEHYGPVRSSFDLSHTGLFGSSKVYWNLPPAALVEHTLARGGARLSSDGALVVETGQHTGRSPNDRYVVKADPTAGSIDWGPNNVPVTPKQFERLHARMVSYMQGRDLFVQDVAAGADPRYQLPIRVVTTSPHHSLFANHMFLRPTLEERALHIPEFTVLHAPFLEGDPERDGLNSGAFVVINFERKMVLIGGTRYAGEIKKSIFSVLNYMLPERGVLCMHASVNVGDDGDAAVFFGLSGTGKTTLSADPERELIGDDEHGWSADGAFNFEGGCYAKLIKLSQKAEPEIWGAVHRYGALIENVVMDDETRSLDFEDATLTQNTRGAYPLPYIPSAAPVSISGHPKTVIMLTCDAYGVLPPISKLTPAQAMYHFMSGYTAKVAGTERGVTEPQATFSACFGSPFLPRHPSEYAEMLGEKLREHGAQAWLVNTGWSGGGYGVGSRMSIGYTRAMVRAALNGSLDGVETTVDPIFGLRIPTVVPGVPAEVLVPRHTWNDKDAYDVTANSLARKFHANFEQFAARAGTEISAAGPRREAPLPSADANHPSMGA